MMLPPGGKEPQYSHLYTRWRHVPMQGQRLLLCGRLVVLTHSLTAWTRPGLGTEWGLDQEGNCTARCIPPQGTVLTYREPVSQSVSQSQPPQVREETAGRVRYTREGVRRYARSELVNRKVNNSAGKLSVGLFVLLCVLVHCSVRSHAAIRG